MIFTIKSIGTVSNDRTDISDDFWGDCVSEIRLDPAFSESALEGIDSFSHLEILYVFHKAINDDPETGRSHPRENPRWPQAGIFAQRKKNRPNFIGSAIVTLIRKEGTAIFVKNLDAVNGTPVIDIKPVMKEFLPGGTVTQPPWVDELMKNYWSRTDARPVPIILDDLLRAIEDHCDFSRYYLDRETGEIIFQSERELGDNAETGCSKAGFNPEHRGERFIPIEPMESHRGHEIMNSFIGTLPEETARHDLIQALSERKPFRRFKDALHNYPDLEKQWHNFHEEDIKKISEEWLHYFGINYEFVSLNDMLK